MLECTQFPPWVYIFSFFSYSFIFLHIRSSSSSPALSNFSCLNFCLLKISVIRSFTFAHLFLCHFYLCLSTIRLLIQFRLEILFYFYINYYFLNKQLLPFVEFISDFMIVILQIHYSRAWLIIFAIKRYFRLNSSHPTRRKLCIRNAKTNTWRKSFLTGFIVDFTDENDPREAFGAETLLFVILSAFIICGRRTYTRRQRGRKWELPLVDTVVRKLPSLPIRSYVILLLK